LTKKAAVYIRKSREDENKPGYRLAVQRLQLPDHARAQGWTPIIYDDGHASAARGKTEALPERARLEADIRAGRVDIILVIELSRLSRDETMQDYVAWLTLCADHRVKLATTSRILDPAQHSDWMLLLMEGGFSSVEMKVLQARMREGRQQAMRTGKFLGGTPPKPYRYDPATRRLVVDPSLLDEMEQIWTRAERMSAKAIAEDLGLPEIAVRRSISDARLQFYQAERSDPDTGETIACDWDPVMTAERAARIRASRRSRKTNTERRDAAGLLSNLGIFYCGYCGRTVKSWTNSKIRKDGSRLDYYACVTKNRKNACPQSRMINHDLVDRRVLKSIRDTLANTERLKDLWDAGRANADPSAKRRQIEQQISDQEQQKQNLVAAIAAGVIDFADAKQQLDTIKTDLVQLREDLGQLLTPTATEPPWDELTVIADGIEQFDFIDQRSAIKHIVERITLYSNDIIIRYPFQRTRSGSYEARVTINKQPANRKSFMALSTGNNRKK
jgi:site-specific DNA recombinase